MKRTAFFISDSTGITAETMGHSLLTQFPQFEFTQLAIPYVNTPEKAYEVLAKIDQASQDGQAKALVFSTLANPEIRNIIANCNGMFIDLFDMLAEPLEQELNSKYAQKVGKSHNIKNFQTYDTRIAAIDFALNTDDGVGINHYTDANLILVGVSRCGKTPTCLYLALKFGIFAANYPITDEDMAAPHLPQALQLYPEKLFGLIITADRLHEIRQQRQPNSNYAAIQQCQRELTHVENMFKRNNIPYLNSTNFSIEEIATKIMSQKKIKRHLY
jgi:regulator of PEP synthase PpsR (kinase-PPPase family)